jgi:AcrR family transcriptional regulator
MDSLDTPPTKLGLRERKKQQTRETIARVALRLFAERGYDHTTLADIAEAADVSPRTIFAYYEGKEEILFCDEASILERLNEALDQRPPGTTTVDAIRDFLGSLPPPDEASMLRKKVVMTTPSLQAKIRARHAEVEPLLTRSIARDLGAGPDDLRARLAAASLLAAFETARERLEAHHDITDKEAMEVLDQVLEFLRGGLEALQHGTAAPGQDGDG